MIKESGGVDAPTNSSSDNISVVHTNKGFDSEGISEDVLINGDPITYILDTFNNIHIGDRNIGELLILSAGSSCIKNGGGIHPKLSGGSGKGKSHACKTMLHLIPNKFWENTSLSGKALYYNPLNPGTIVFSDDTRLSNDLEEVLRRSTSDFQQGIEHKTVDINRNGKTLCIPPRITWWLASVTDEFDVQTLNRQVGVSVDDSSNTDMRVLDNQLDMAVNGMLEYPNTDEVMVCNELFATIKPMFVNVSIPFAKDIIWRGGNNRRNLPIFLDMLRVYALFNYRQRPIDQLTDDGYVISASKDDFYRASTLYHDRAETQSTKLTTDELKIVDFLSSYGTANTNTISKAIGMPYQTTRHLLKGRTNGNGGLLGKVVGLEVDDVLHDTDGRNRRTDEYSLIGYDVLASYGNIVSLKE